LPLDEFQKTVLRVLMPLRSPQSVFAGGSVLHRHGFRLSDDQDLFHATGENMAAIARRDVAALKAAGLEVADGVSYEGLVEVVVSQADESATSGGVTKLQWVESGSWNFFSPVPDPDFGWRLHMADLAVNKVLAAGGRKQVRDYVDMFLIHRHIMPLWAAIWAAPGKDEAWSPMSLAEKIAMTNGFRQADIDREILSTIELSAAEVGVTVRSAIEEALDTFPLLPDESAGMLFVNSAGGLVTDLSAISSGMAEIRAIPAERGGAWPSGGDIDRLLIDRVVEAYGWEGSNPPNGHDPGAATTR
jgi:hypothetical protein